MPNIHRILILVAFSVSGCAGLVYESIWSHYLGLYLGHAAYAQTLTLAIFMGGMTLGALGASRFIARIPNTLLVYALIELILGVLGIGFHVVYTVFIQLSYETVFPGLGSPALISLYKWSSAAILILPQSIALGATFPLLCSALIRRERAGSGQHISILYFCNSIGAALGALIATFILLPWVGMPGALLTAGLANIVVALVTYVISKLPEYPSPAQYQPASPAKSNTGTIVLIAAAITGAVSFMYEIAWIRMLNLVLGTSFHAFEIMLSAFIAGLAFGGLWIKSRIEQIDDLLYYTGLVQVCMGLAAISTLVLYVESFDWVATLLKEALKFTPTGYVFYNITTSLISGLIMIPATFCAGMTLPLLTTHLIRKSNNEDAIGKVYASNTVGAIIGIVFAVHIGMTTLGLKWLIVFAGVVDIGLGIYLVFYQKQPDSGASKMFKTMLAGLVGLAVLAVLTPLEPSRLASGTFRYARSHSPDLVFYRDGKTASVSVSISDKGSASIATNGKPDAALNIGSGQMSADEITMVMLGVMPILVKPDTQDVAAIGFGSGLTSHTVLGAPGLTTLDTIEIEPVMVEGARLFMARNNRVFEDPRSRIHFEDAKTFFASRQKKYDAIISEPSNPWVAGVGNLFTIEFYTHLKRYLKDDGLLIQWLHLYEISLPTVVSALASLNEVFPAYDLYATVTGDILIVASKQANTDLSIKAGWSDLSKELKQELEMVGLDSIEKIASRKLASKNEISALIDVIWVAKNSDYFPILSLHAPKDRFVKASANDLFGLQLLGIKNTPYQREFIRNARDGLDDVHPFASGAAKAKKISDRLIDGNNSYMGFSDIGIVETLDGNSIDCSDDDSLVGWVAAFYKVMIMANNYGLEELREYLLDKAQGFRCLDELAAGSRLILRASTIALSGFDNSTRDELSNTLDHADFSKIPGTYQAFIWSCYLFNLIADNTVVTRKDVDSISKSRHSFDLPNLWLEALLAKKLEDLAKY